jgi:hypothetical protein
MGLFGKTRYLDPDIEDWCLETWGWLMANLGGIERLRRTPLAAPTPEFFPPTAAQGHERALYLFERVKTLMGMADMPARLEAFERPPARQRLGLFGKEEIESAPGGSFRLDGDTLVIGYASDLVGRPETLIVTLSHELARGLVESIRKPIPGGGEFRELASELALAFAGFGLFGVRGAYKPAQSRNPFAQRGITFSEPIWAFALALFAAMKGIEAPVGALGAVPADLTLKAERYFKRNQDLLAPLRAIA